MTITISKTFQLNYSEGLKVWKLISDTHKDFLSENFYMIKDYKTIADKVAKVMWVL